MNWSLLAKRKRVPLGFLLAAVYLLLVRPTPRSLLIGLPIAFAGILVRAWASGHIMKNDRLATSGPYAFTRNPLYVGSFLIAIGFALVAHWLAVAAVVAFFLLVYAPTIARERANIENRFPAAYEQYASNVPAFLPRLTPWRNDALGTGTHFSPALYLRHGEWKAALVYVIVTVWLVIRMRGAATS